MVNSTYKVLAWLRNYDGADGLPKHLYMLPHLLLGNILLIAIWKFKWPAWNTLKQAGWFGRRCSLNLRIYMVPLPTTEHPFLLDLLDCTMVSASHALRRYVSRKRPWWCRHQENGGYVNDIKSWLQEDFLQTTSKTATNWMWPAMGSKKASWSITWSAWRLEYFCHGPQTLRLGRIVWCKASTSSSLHPKLHPLQATSQQSFIGICDTVLDGPFCEALICTKSVSVNRVSCVAGKCFEQTLWTCTHSPALVCLVWFTSESRGQETIELRIDVHGLQNCHHLDLDTKAESCRQWRLGLSAKHSSPNCANCASWELQSVAVNQFRVDEGMFVSCHHPSEWMDLEPHFLTPTFCNNLSTGTQLRKPNHNSALLKSLNHRISCDSLVVLPALQGLHGRITQAMRSCRKSDGKFEQPSHLEVLGHTAGAYVWQPYRWTDGLLDP